MINKVTFTGADNNTIPRELYNISKEYPFVEWGILLGAPTTWGGSPRFPAWEWIDQLLHFNGLLKESGQQMQLSLHICGKFARLMTQGNAKVFDDLRAYIEQFDRVQLNFHSIPHYVENNFFVELERLNKEIIFQYDEVNDEVVKRADAMGIQCSALFDTSGGNGILPEVWPAPLEGIPVGYAGGLGPDNIEIQVERILAAIPPMDTRPVWVDMETHVRSNDDEVFDLKKIRKVCKILKSYVDGTETK